MLAFMKQYGKTVIFALAAVMVFGIAFRMRLNGHTGFIEAAYAKAMEQENGADIASVWNMEAVKAAAARKHPAITFRCEKICPKTPVNVGAMLTAADADGSGIDVKILDITTEDGRSLLYRTDEDRKRKRAAYAPNGVVFPSVGVYVMEAEASDREKKTTKARFRIPVTGH